MAVRRLLSNRTIFNLVSLVILASCIFWYMSFKYAEQKEEIRRYMHALEEIANQRRSTYGSTEQTFERLRHQSTRRHSPENKKDADAFNSDKNALKENDYQELSVIIAERKKKSSPKHASQNLQSKHILSPLQTKRVHNRLLPLSLDRQNVKDTARELDDFKRDLTRSEEEEEEEKDDKDVDNNVNNDWPTERDKMYEYVLDSKQTVPPIGQFNEQRKEPNTMLPRTLYNDKTLPNSPYGPMKVTPQKNSESPKGSEQLQHAQRNSRKKLQTITHRRVNSSVKSAAINNPCRNAICPGSC